MEMENEFSTIISRKLGFKLLLNFLLLETERIEFQRFTSLIAQDWSSELLIENLIISIYLQLIEQESLLKKDLYRQSAMGLELAKLFQQK